MRTLSFFTLVVLCSLFSLPAQAIEKCGQGKRVTCIVDGDTIWLRGEKIRLMGYDTPETTNNFCGGDKERQLGAEATNRLMELLTANSFSVHRDGKDRYGRTLAVIRIGNSNVGTILVNEGLARYWPDGHEFWCD